VLEMLGAGLGIKALVHVTSDGFLNLARIRQPIGYRIERLPPPQAIFMLVQEMGGVPDAEMFKTYNMGTGFCIVVDQADVDNLRATARRYGVESDVLGHTVDDPRRRVWVEPRQLVGENKEFSKS
jgi:phosphoribosylformylglycinamidine cyclo-ligase